MRAPFALVQSATSQVKMRQITVSNETGRFISKVTITITVAGRSPETHYPEIQRLVEHAGTTSVSLRFEHSGA